MGSRAGVVKGAAGRVGLSVDVYVRNVENGLKWCTGCRLWAPRSDFSRDRARGDGLKAQCRECCMRRYRQTYVRRPRPSPGRRFVGARESDKKQARRRVNYLVEAGLLSNPNSLLCSDCGHQGDDRRHEYDHYQGYAPEHHETVEAVCTKCHASRERGRRHG